MMERDTPPQPFERFLLLLRQEAWVLLSQRRIYFVFALALLAAPLRISIALAIGSEHALDILSGPRLWGVGMGWCMRVLALFLGAEGAMGFSQEMAWGTSKTVLTCPISRAMWVWAKTVVLIALAWSVLGAASILAAAVAIWGGWGDIMQDGQVIYTQGETAAAAVKAVLLAAVLLPAVGFFGLAVGAFFSSSGPAVSATLILGLVILFVAQIIPGGEWLFLQHLETPFGLVEKMGQGFSVRMADRLWQSMYSAGIAWLLFLGITHWRLKAMDVV